MLLWERLEQGLGREPDKPAVVCLGRTLTHGELVRRSARLAALLGARGVGKGERVALWMKNSVDMAALYLACFRSGVVAVPLNVRYKPDEARYAMDLTGCRLAFADAQLAPALAEAAAGCASLGAGFTVHEGEVLESGGPVTLPDAPPPRPGLLAADPAVILFTSGSTGRPKGVVHTQGSLGSGLEHKIAGQDLAPDEIGMVGTQISHVGGLFGILMPTLAVGGTCVMASEFEPGEYIRLLKEYRPTLLMLLPTELLEVLEHPHAQDADFSHIRSMLIAGDAVPHHVYELYRALAGSELMEGFGMTECEGFCLQPRHEPRKPGSIGKPVPGVELRVVASGREAGVDEPGELWLRSDCMCAGYWENPEATAAAFHDGWLRTGDLVRRDTDGFYHFVSRIKELIVRGGSNISPAEVEDVLDDHPGVEGAGVVGFDDAHFGQVVGAFIEPAHGADRPSEAELATFAAKRLGDYMVPERWVFVDRLPRNAVGKLDRHGLHRMSAELMHGRG